MFALAMVVGFLLFAVGVIIGDVMATYHFEHDDEAYGETTKGNK